MIMNLPRGTFLGEGWSHAKHPKSGIAHLRMVALFEAWPAAVFWFFLGDGGEVFIENPCAKKCASSSLSHAPLKNFFTSHRGSIPKFFWDGDGGKIPLPEKFLRSIFPTLGGSFTNQLWFPPTQAIPTYRRRQAMKAQRRVSAHSRWDVTSDGGEGSGFSPQMRIGGKGEWSDTSSPPHPHSGGEAEKKSSPVCEIPTPKIPLGWVNPPIALRKNWGRWMMRVNLLGRSFLAPWREAHLYVAMQRCFVASDGRPSNLKKQGSRGARIFIP